jgi:ParB-like chromosome segregation protein Spo0J
MSVLPPPPLDITPEAERFIEAMSEQQALVPCLGIATGRDDRTLHLIDGHHRCERLRRLGYAYANVFVISLDHAMAHASLAKVQDFVKGAVRESQDARDAVTMLRMMMSAWMP